MKNAATSPSKTKSSLKDPTDTSKKYITLEEGLDFRTIAKVMTKNGYVMNHATARNQLIMAMEKLLGHIATEVSGATAQKGSPPNQNLQELLKDPNIHEYLSDILFAAHKQEMENKK